MSLKLHPAFLACFIGDRMPTDMLTTTVLMTFQRDTSKDSIRKGEKGIHVTLTENLVIVCHHSKHLSEAECKSNKLNNMVDKFEIV